LRAGELPAATMQHCESVVDPGMIKNVRDWSNKRVVGGVRRKWRGARNELQRNVIGIPTENIGDR
jgi:hypothetical protein